ncbi:Copper chaperone [Handroanthus impetiginosus]|uniref:Copper chaperone n=1 Tax=Handroanthus impetiginosus TaxID=429701 RepID=A0A2G9G500_9LAMI|nr:Copper chaperone [Handroanthus impetiginosus]
MGEEEKKPEEKKPEEAKKEEKKEKAPEAEKPEEDVKKDDKKSEKPEAPALPPPQEIVLRVYMHCEGCARKVRRCLKGFEGVKDVITDCRTSKVVVKGEKADPLKVLERVQRKSHRQVDLISPIPKPPAEEPKKPEEKEVPKPEEKKEELPVITAVLGVYMHCEACAQEIKKRIMRMNGVESAEPDLKSSQVTVKGRFEQEKLVDYVYKRTGKHATILKMEPEKKEEEKPKEGKEEKEEKKAEKGEKKAKRGEEESKENKEGVDAGGSDAAAEPPAKAVEARAAEAEAEDTKMELKRNEFYHYYPQNHQVYPQRFVQEYYAYPPQIFSDENPNACSVM